MSIHFVQDFVTVHNRTPHPREVRYDGQTGIIPPYPAFVKMSKIAADRAVVQNRIPGTENPYNDSEFQSYIGVAEWADRCPIGPIAEQPASESLDRSQLPPDRQNIRTVKHGRQIPERSNMNDPEGIRFDNPTS